MGSWASLVAQLVKNMPAMWEIWVQSLGWEDPLEKRKATHSSILARELICRVHHAKCWAGWSKAGIQITGRNVNNLRYADDTTFMAESDEELKSQLMKVKVESEKVGLKRNIQKMKIMASRPITSWEIDGETVETVSDFILGGSNHCRWWLQPWN